MTRLNRQHHVFTGCTDKFLTLRFIAVCTFLCRWPELRIAKSLVIFICKDHQYRKFCFDGFVVNYTKKIRLSLDKLQSTYLNALL